VGLENHGDGPVPGTIPSVMDALFYDAFHRRGNKMHSRDTLYKIAQRVIAKIIHPRSEQAIKINGTAIVQ